jgi:hypothetical protein
VEKGKSGMGVEAEVKLILMAWVPTCTITKNGIKAMRSKKKKKKQ